MKNLLSIKILSIIVILLSFSGCRWFEAADTPFLAFTQIKIPEGTPKFKKGFENGCGTMLYARGNILYRDLYQHELDPALIDDSEYMFGYKRGYSYCFQYSVGPTGHFGGGADAYISRAPGATTPFTQGMTSANIDNTVNYGPLNWMTAPNGGLDGVVDVFSKNPYGQGGVFSAYPTWGTPNVGSNFTW